LSNQAIINGNVISPTPRISEKGFYGQMGIPEKLGNKMPVLDYIHPAIS
jgi:hypothetical protein